MGLLKNMSREPVSRLELRQPVLCNPTDSVHDAVIQMRERQLGCVIAVDSDQKPIGMFTESMLTQLMASSPETIDKPIADYLGEHWPWVLESEPITVVLEAMQSKNIRFIGVVNGAGQVVGLTGQKGLMEYISEHFPQQVMVQRVGSRPPTEREGA